MDYALIPFALRKTDGRIVDADEVQKGLACGCICPSCQSPLIARKGDVKAWHFAHVSRADEGDTHSGCDFSWAVSVRLMTRQLLREGLSIELPELRDVVDIPTIRGLATQHTYEVVPRQSLPLPPCHVDARFGDTLVDVLAHVGSGALAIYITHPGRPTPDALRTPPAPCAGVIAISLAELAFEEDPRAKSQSCRQSLQNFLTNNVRSKTWIFHPEQASRRQEELEALRARRGSPSSQRSTSLPIPSRPQAIPIALAPAPSYTVRKPVPGDPLRYVCVNCDFRWGNQTGGMDECPQCGSLFMVTRIRTPESPRY